MLNDNVNASYVESHCEPTLGACPLTFPTLLSVGWLYLKTKTSLYIASEKKNFDLSEIAFCWYKKKLNRNLNT